jgi:hypothetical protein
VRGKLLYNIKHGNYIQLTDAYIERCNNFLENDDFDEQIGRKLVIELNAMYDWMPNYYNGLWGADSKTNSFNIDYASGKQSLCENVLSIRSKLIAYRSRGYKIPPMPQSNIENKVNVINQSKNEVVINQNISVMFENSKKQIEKMTSLSEKETEEALKELERIKAIVDSQESSKKKWDKIRSSLKWVTEKSIDLAGKFAPVIFEIGKQQGWW